MPVTPLIFEQLLDKANELYWNSDRTVDEIVRELGIGRSSFYTSIRPLKGGASCPTCGDRLAFTTRSNRDAGKGTCQECGIELIIEGPEDLVKETVDELRRQTAEPDDARVPSRWRKDLASVDPQRVAMVGGAAALGMMVGMAASRAVREMK